MFDKNQEFVDNPVAPVRDVVYCSECGDELCGLCGCCHTCEAAETLRKAIDEDILNDIECEEQ